MGYYKEKGLSRGPFHSLFLYSDPPPYSVPPVLMAQNIYKPNLYPYNNPNIALRLDHSTRTYLPMKMEQTECSETPAYKFQKPGNHPKESIQHSVNGESLKSRLIEITCDIFVCVVSVWQRDLQATSPNSSSQLVAPGTHTPQGKSRSTSSIIIQINNFGTIPYKFDFPLSYYSPKNHAAKHQLRTQKYHK